MGVKSRKSSNSEVIRDNILDGDIRIIGSSFTSGSGPRLVKQGRVVSVSPFAEVKDSPSPALPMASKVKEYGEYLAEHESDFYLRPQLFHQYLEELFSGIENRLPGSVENGDVIEGRQEHGIRLSMGKVDESEYLLLLQKMENSGLDSFVLDFYRRKHGRDYPIATVSVLPASAKSGKIDDPEDRLMFKGFLKFLEMEEGEIPPSYYRVLPPRRR